MASLPDDWDDYVEDFFEPYPGGTTTLQPGFRPIVGWGLPAQANGGRIYQRGQLAIKRQKNMGITRFEVTDGGRGPVGTADTAVTRAAACCRH
eukprot:gene7279-biopygen9064